MKYGDQRIYRTFEEFEREELRRPDRLSLAIDDVLGEMFAEELDFELKGAAARSSDDDED
jgi:hypothetical protein